VRLQNASLRHLASFPWACHSVQDCALAVWAQSRPRNCVASFLLVDAPAFIPSHLVGQITCPSWSVRVIEELHIDRHFMHDVFCPEYMSCIPARLSLCALAICAIMALPCISMWTLLASRISAHASYTVVPYTKEPLMQLFTGFFALNAD
jgi:hypothetical protein